MRAATFTTYINAQTDPGLEQAFARQAQIAQSSYATITQAAQAATRATAGLLGGTGTAGGGSAEIRQRADALRSTTAAAAEAERSSIKLATATRRESSEASAAARSNTALARSLQTTATALNVVQGPLGPIAGRLGALSRAVTELTGARLGLAAFGAALFSIGSVANDYANVQNRLRPLFQSQVQFNGAFGDVVRIARATRQELGPLAELYSRITIGGRDIGLSQARIGRLTELAAKTATISGGSADVQQRGLVQFSQGLGRGTLQGQDLKAVLEDIPVLGQQIAAGFKNADGSIGTTIGHLRDLGAEGKLTGTAIADALERSSQRIDSAFEKIPLTLSTARVQFKNAIEVFFGSFDQSVGFTSKLAAGIGLIADHLRVVVSLGLGIGTAFAGIKIGGLARDAAANIGAMRAQAETVAELDRAWIRDAEVSKAAFESQITSLEQERQAVRREIAQIQERTVAQQTADAESIASIERRTAAAVAGYEAEGRAAAARFVEAKAAQALAARAAGGTDPVGTRTRVSAAYADLTSSATAASNAEAAGTAAVLKGQAEAQNRATSSALALRGAEEKLSLINRELQATYGGAARATETLETATANVATRVGFFRQAGSSLIAFLGGPWGIAFAAAATAIYLLATAQTAAERATARAEDSQRSFANSVDRSTGKVYDQIGAVQKLALVQKQGVSISESADQFNSRKRSITSDVFRLSIKDQGGIPGRYLDNFEVENGIRGRTPEQKRVAVALDAFKRGDQGSIGNLQRLLADPAIQRGVPGLAEKITQLGGQFDELGKSVREVTSGAARQRVLQGRARPGDLPKAFGETGTVTEKPKLTPAQAKLEADRRAARTPVEQARTDVEAARNALKQDPSEENINRLATAQRGLRDATASATQARRDAAAGRAQEKRDARDATQEAKDEAAARRDAATEALLLSNQDTTSPAFLAARLKILKTYDDEINRLDTVGAASRSATVQRIADLKKEEAAAVGRGTKRDDILAGYDDAPKSIDTARAKVAELRKDIGHLVDGVSAKTDDNPLGRGLYTDAAFRADVDKIENGLRKPLRDLQRDFDRGVANSSLILEGRGAEAAALEQRNRLLDGGLAISEQEYQGLVRNERQQLRINDALAARERVVSTITGALDSARNTTADLLTNAQTGNLTGDVFKNALSTFRTQFAQINSREIVEKLFAGSDEKLRALLEGRSGVDTAIGGFTTSIGGLTTESTRVQSTFQLVATAAEKLSSRLDGAVGGGVNGAGVSTGFDAGALQGAVDAGREATSDTSGDVVVTGRRSNGPSLAGNISVAQALSPLIGGGGGGGRLPNATSVFNQIGGTLFSGLDRLVDKVIKPKTYNVPLGADGSFDLGKATGSTFFRKIGDSFGDALSGVGKGVFASSIASAIGINQNQTGAAIGGGIGGVLTGIKGVASALGPFASVAAPLLGIAGGLIGSLFGGGGKIGGQSFSSAGLGATFGNDSASKSAGQQGASQALSSLQSIADQLGGSLGNFGTITVGEYKGKFRVNDHGTNLKSNNDVMQYDTLQEAEAFALQQAILKGGVAGIGQTASNLIRKYASDINTGLTRALAVQAIPKQLLALTNPAKAAVNDLNDQFKTLISYLKDGSASASEYADAQKLYDLERAQALKQATSAIDDLLTSMTATASSPLNKRTIYDNAGTALAGFQTDIAAGKSVDQNDLVSAARNFQDASRALYGSSQDFFSDFDMLRSLLQQARTNAGISSDVADLPASPFTTDSTVASAIASLQASTSKGTSAQTDAIVAGLGDVVDSIGDLSAYLAAAGYGGYGGSPIDLLPGFSKTG